MTLRSNDRLSVGACFALAASLLAVGGCSNTADYGVVLLFTPQELSDRIDHIELSLVSACFTEEALGPRPFQPFNSANLDRGSVLGGLGDVEDGAYSLYARGIGPCVAAVGCVPVEFTAGGETIFEGGAPQNRRSE